MDTTQSKNRLLLVDGDPKSLRVLDVSLKKSGFEVMTATSGHEALKLLEANQPDLIISDTDLDEMDGFELCSKIKARPDWAKIPFLFVSGRKSIEDKIRGLELGVDDYLTKPIYIREIGIRVRTALQRAERERMESRREGRTRFAGDLADVGVVDLVQTIELNRKSGIIHVANRDGRHGSIYFRDGKVIDAEVGRLSGANAVYRLFTWSEGQFAVEFKQIRRHDVIDAAMAPLLMEGMRRLDESTHLLEKLPSPKSVLEVDCRVLAEELAELPDEMNTVLRLCDGARTLHEIIEDSDQPDLEALNIINKLLAGQIIFSRKAPHDDGESEPSERLARWLSEGGTEDGAAAEDIGESPEYPALLDQEVDSEVVPAVTPAPANVSPRSADEKSSSADEKKGTTWPRLTEGTSEASNEFAKPEETLKGMRIDGPLSHQETKAESAPSRAESAANTIVRATRETRMTKPLGLAERLLSEDSAVGASAMHEAIAEDGGRVDGPQSSERNTREYGNSAAAAAAALVHEVVSLSREIPVESPSQIQPERPTKEVDWGSWSDSTAHHLKNAEQTDAFPPMELSNVGQAALLTETLFPVEGDASTNIPSSAKTGTNLPEILSDKSADGDADVVPVLASVGVSMVATTEPASSSPQARVLTPDSGSPIILASGKARQRWLLSFGIIVIAAVALLGLRKKPSPHADSPAPAASSSVASSSLPVPQPISESVKVVAAAPPAAVPALADKSVKGLVELASAPSVKLGMRRKCLETDDDGQGKAKAVWAACRPALDADPKDVSVIVILARANIDRGHFLEARSLAKKALATDPQRFEAYVFLGAAELELGKIDEARAAYTKYLELAPDGPFAHQLRSILRNL
jgi:CheY-like chemotaxis protein